MQLIHYLDQYFYTKEQLLDITGSNSDTLTKYQHMDVMPKPSYSLNLQIQGTSFFGQFDQSRAVEYYAKGYAYWFGLLEANAGSDKSYALFCQCYTDTLVNLQANGFITRATKLKQGLATHLASEWQHFLNGTYGLCTKSGLPEQIAQKELAICIIEELTNAGNFDRQALERAVNLLDKASAIFAPHERNRSSRHRLIDEVRLRFQLPEPQIY